MTLLTDFIHFVEIKLLLHLSAGSLDYIEEEYVDLDGQETDSQTENAQITKVSKRIQPFATIQEDFEEKSDIEGSGQETNDDEDLQETSRNNDAHKVLEEEEGSGDEKLGK